MGLGIGLYFFMSFEGSSYWFVYPNRGRIFLRENSNGLTVRFPECGYDILLTCVDLRVQFTRLIFRALKYRINLKMSENENVNLFLA